AAHPHARRPGGGGRRAAGEPPRRGGLAAGGGMNTLAALRSAWRSLAGNPLRSLLTMLGIIIGVSAVITMIAIGAGAQQRIEDEIKRLGSNLMMVRPGSVTQGGVRLGT